MVVGLLVVWVCFGCGWVKLTVLGLGFGSLLICGMVFGYCGIIVVLLLEGLLSVDEFECSTVLALVLCLCGCSLVV